MLFAQSILSLITWLDPVSKHGRDEFLALRASEHPTDRANLAELSERQHRLLQNFVNGKTVLSERTLADFAKLGDYGEFMRTCLTDIVKRTVPINSAKAKFGIRHPGHKNWKKSYQALQLPGLRALIFPGDEAAADYVFGIDCSIVDFIRSLDQGQIVRDAALGKIALPPDLLAIFACIQAHADVKELGKHDERMLVEFYVGCYFYLLAVREASMPESPRYITDFLGKNPPNFKQYFFDHIHENLKNHKKGWQDVCDLIRSEKSETGVMDWPSVWKALKAKQLHPPFLWKFCCAYHEIVSPLSSRIVKDKRLYYEVVYMTLLHLSVLDRLVKGNPVIRIAPDKKVALPLDSTFVKYRIAHFCEYVSFAQIQLERRKADKVGSRA